MGHMSRLGRRLDVGPRFTYVTGTAREESEGELDDGTPTGHLEYGVEGLPSSIDRGVVCTSGSTTVLSRYQPRIRDPSIILPD